MELRVGVDFERKIYVKQQAAWLLRQDLRKVKRGEEIAIGTATDPYQPAEKRYEVTRGILEELALHHGLEIGIVTKSDLILRDVELLRQVAEHNSLFVNLTITTLNTKLARVLEPRAPRPDLRLGAVRQLVSAGINAGVICAPVLPGITDSPASLDALVRATKKVGGKYIYANPLFLKPCSASVFLPFLEKEFPQLVESYRKRFAERAFVSKAYSKRISELVSTLRQKHGISREFASRSQSLHPPAQETEQMSLFGGYERFQGRCVPIERAFRPASKAPPRVQAFSPLLRNGLKAPAVRATLKRRSTRAPRIQHFGNRLAFRVLSAWIVQLSFRIAAWAKKGSGLGVACGVRHFGQVV